MSEIKFNQSGTPEEFVDFYWDAIEPDQRPEIEAELKKAVAMALCKLSSQLIQAGGRTQRQLQIAANCMAFAAHLHPDQSLTGEEICKSLGDVKCAHCGEIYHKAVSKENFFRRVNQWRDMLRLPRVAGAWKESARKSIKIATTKNHEKRKQQRPIGIVGLIAKANSGAGN
jgi:hypothetical protein